MKLRYNGPLSNFAFKLNLRRYNKVQNEDPGDVSPTTGTVTIKLEIPNSGVNSDPVADNDEKTTKEDTLLDCATNATTAAAATAADLGTPVIEPGCFFITSDPDGSWDTLTVSIQTQGLNGVATIVGDGTSLQYTYTPAVNFVGTDVFTYKVRRCRLTLSSPC